MAALNSHCCICKAVLLPAQRLTGICGQAECRRQNLLQQGRETLRYRNETLRKRFSEVRAQTAAVSGIGQPERFPLAIVPSFINGLAPLSEERKARFRANIAKVIEEAWDKPLDNLPPPPVSPRPEIERFFGGACALCRGACCRLGGDQAFFRAETVHRFRNDHPEFSQEQMIDVYMSYLQEMSIEESCVYHGEHGCVLPREIRSIICNSYFCEGLLDIEAELDVNSPRGFFVQANGTYLASAAFLDGDQTTQVAVRVGFVNMSDSND